MGAYANRMLAKVFKNLLWHFSDQEKKLFLTFDDGPSEQITDWILDLLESFDAKATFFCLGKHVKAFPDSYASVLKAGHSVGNHTYSHLNGWKTVHKNYVNDIHLAAHFIDSGLFRPPYGKIKPVQMKWLRKFYRIIMWDILTHDYDRTRSPEYLFNRIRKHTRPGSILVFHDSIQAEKNLKIVLPKTLKYFSKLGYEFSAIPMQTLPGSTV